ncbi:S-adenosylmethionine-binding protein [Agrobacterium vitis]|uniref:MT-A70 family methyltransferase n=1 Tax=Agrobacterium vitis TaxID=373 RepID=UPI0015D931A4|nr:MT-A70 family methyltransferase [Agrobacterium vitis]BCH58694.1 S-adenosylmethionine-binding protein [Agrobacterium vitis]
MAGYASVKYPKPGSAGLSLILIAIRDGEVVTKDVAQVIAANKVAAEGCGYLIRDQKDGNRWYPTDRAREMLVALSLSDVAPVIQPKTKVATERRIDSIRAEHRLRTLNETTVLALMDNIRDYGLETPITVYGDVDDAEVDLGAGGHRLEACKRLGLEFILCFHKRGDDLDRQLCEIDENLIRADLTPSDRALFLHRRKEIYLVKFPDTAREASLKRGDVSPSRQIGETGKRFTAATAQATGQKERTIQRDVERGEKISRTALQMLRGTRHDKGVTLDQLKRLETAEAQERFARDLIAADKAVTAESKAIRTTNQKHSRDMRLHLVSAIAEHGRRKGGDVPRGAYAIGYADPPWQQEAWSDETGQDKGLKYPAMPVEEIKALCAGDRSPFTMDALLFLWVTANRLPDGIDVLRAWGFDYVTCMAWDKVHIGMGRWVRDRHELLLIGKRGKVSLAPLPGTQPDSLYAEAKTEHSRKPVWFAEQIDRLWPQLPKLELFQRKESLAEGDVRLAGKWDFWGFEATQSSEATQTAPVSEGGGA